MLRMILGPPNFVEWNAPWHDIVHYWNEKVPTPHNVLRCQPVVWRPLSPPQFDYFDWSRYTGKGNGIGSQMVGLHVVCSRFQACNSGFWSWFTICEPRLCQQLFFLTNMFPAETHWNSSMASWLQSLVWELGPGASIYGQTWYPFSMYDPMRRWNFQCDLLEGSVTQNSAHLESRTVFPSKALVLKDVAPNARQWMIKVDDFVKFSKAFYRIEYSPLSDPVLLKGVPRCYCTLLWNFTNGKLGHHWRRGKASWYHQPNTFLFLDSSMQDWTMPCENEKPREIRNLHIVRRLLATNVPGTNIFYWTRMSLWFCGWNCLMQWCLQLCSSDLQPCHWPGVACKNGVSCKHECSGL